MNFPTPRTFVNLVSGPNASKSFFKKSQNTKILVDQVSIYNHHEIQHTFLCPDKYHYMRFCHVFMPNGPVIVEILFVLQVLSLSKVQ